MAIPRCPKCESSSFENSEVEPRRSNFKLIFVHCSSCGAVVGVVDYYNIGAELKEIRAKLGV